MLLTRFNPRLTKLSTHLNLLFIMDVPIVGQQSIVLEEKGADGQVSEISSMAVGWRVVDCYFVLLLSR